MACAVPLFAALILATQDTPPAARVSVNAKEKRTDVTLIDKKSSVEVLAEFDKEAPEGEVRLKLTIKNRSKEVVPAAEIAIDEPYTGVLDLDQRFFTEVETLAGPNVKTFSSAGKQVRLQRPYGLLLDRGTLYIADGYPGSTVYTWKGGVLEPFVRVADPTALALIGGYLYVCENWDALFLRFALGDRRPQLLAGGGKSPDAPRDGIGREALFAIGLWGIASSGGGAYLNESGASGYNKQIRFASEIAEERTKVQTLRLPIINHGAIDTITLKGRQYIVAPSAHQIILIDPQTGETRAIAGNKNSGWKDGLGNTANFIRPNGLDVVGNTIYVSDHTWMIRQITLMEGEPPFEASSWAVKTIAGTGARSTLNGPGQEATFASPFYLASDGDRTVYVSEYEHGRVRMIKAKEGSEFPLGGREGMVKVLEADREVPDPASPEKKKRFVYALPALAPSGQKGDQTTRELKFSKEKPVLSFSLVVRPVPPGPL